MLAESEESSEVESEKEEHHAVADHGKHFLTLLAGRSLLLNKTDRSLGWKVTAHVHGFLNGGNDFRFLRLGKFVLFIRALVFQILLLRNHGWKNGTLVLLLRLGRRDVELHDAR